MQVNNTDTADKNTATRSYFTRLVAWVRKNTLLTVIVVIPTFVSIIYYGLIASDIYISTSEYVVRSPQKQQPSGIGALLQGAGFAKASDDVYSVHDYMLSRDAMFTLNNSLDLKKIYSRDSIDLFSRFGVLDPDQTFESFYKYFSKRITIDLDSTSSISTLEVRAFTADDAWRINEQLIEMSESLVNKMNERARTDLIGASQIQVDIARKASNAAASALSAYRNKQSIFDTDKQSQFQLEQVGQLQTQLVAIVSQLNQIRVLAPKNPQIPVLENQRNTLQAEIAKQTAEVTGSKQSLASKSSEYNKLQLDSEFAASQLTAALASLELAKSDAQRKQLYVERIVQPNKPDKAMEPRRIRNIAATFVLGMVIWGVLMMLIAGVKEHQS